MKKKNIKLTICYDGSSFHGWQKSPLYPSIEDELSSALFTTLQEKVTLQAASRTDAGVHAYEQVANFFLERDVDLKQLQYSLNQLLPSSILVTNLEVVDQKFHPTLDATYKEYEYKITTSKYLDPFKRNYYWHFPKSLNLELMKEASQLLLGRKDFKALTNFKEEPYKDTIRTIYELRILQDKEDYFFTIVGDHFLYKMARNIVGLLCYVGAGKIALENVESILSEKLRKNAAITAPANGLALKKIHYSTHPFFAVK